MNAELSAALVGFKDIATSVHRGISHTQVRVSGESVKFRRPGFLADIFIHRRTREISIARIDTKDERTLRIIVGVLSRFHF